MKNHQTPLLQLLLTLSLTAAASAQTPEPSAPKQEPVAAAKEATPAQAESIPNPASSPVAPAEKFSEAVTAAIGPQTEGKARVVFFRPSKFAGGAIGFIVREKDVELGKLRSGNFFVLNVEPGKHTYSVHSEAKDDSIHEVEAGETYFVAGSISMGFLAGHPHLTASDLAAFEAALPKLKPSKPLK